MCPTIRKRRTREGEADKQTPTKQQKSENRDSEVEPTASESHNLNVGDLTYAADCGMLYKAKVLKIRDVDGKDGDHWGGGW